EHALLTVLPDPDHGHVHGGPDLADVREPLGADGGGAALGHGRRALRHGARIAHGLAGIGLAGDDQGALERGDERRERGGHEGVLPGWAVSRARTAAPSRAACEPALAGSTGVRATTSIASSAIPAS